MIDHLAMLLISYSFQQNTGKKERGGGVIFISILIHIYIEMNPNAKQHALERSPGCTEASAGITQKNDQIHPARQSSPAQHFSENKNRESKHLNSGALLRVLISDFQLIKLFTLNFGYLFMVVWELSLDLITAAVKSFI